MRRLLEPAGDRRSSRCPDGVELPPEDGETFADNALPKARPPRPTTGRPSIADDSGIEAAALGGAPGVRSARYAGRDATDEENLAKLMREAPAGSGLRYVCALAYVDPETGEERVFFGDCRGRMARVRAGSSGFRLRPRVRARRDRGQPDDGRADRRREGRDQPSRPRGARALREWIRALSVRACVRLSGGRSVPGEARHGGAGAGPSAGTGTGARGLIVSACWRTTRRFRGPAANRAVFSTFLGQVDSGVAGDTQATCVCRRRGIRTG